MCACGSMYFIWRVSLYLTHLTYLTYLTFCSGPRPARRLGRRRWNRLSRGIAQRQQNTLCALRLTFFEFFHRFAKTVQPKIRFALGAVEPVKKCGEINQLAASIHEIEVEDLLPCHSFRWTHYKGELFGDNGKFCGFL